LAAPIGRYRILRLLGACGLGAVYEAEQEQSRRRVALKVIKATRGGETGAIFVRVCLPSLDGTFLRQKVSLPSAQRPGWALQG